MSLCLEERCAVKHALPPKRRPLNHQALTDLFERKAVLDG